MALIEEITVKRFANVKFGSDHDFIPDLDLGLFQAAKMVENIYELALYPTNGTDTDTVGAAAMSLIAYLGQLGSIVDALAAQHE